MPPLDLSAMPERRKLTIFLLMALGQFMALLDVQIVASSVAEISAGLAAAPDESSWIQTAYLMAEIVMIPLSGVLSRAFSTRWLFTASAAAFTLTSIGCGFATSIQSMILLRALQGFVGGAMVPTVFATGFALFKGPKQAMIAAILGISGSLAPTLGPTLGGWITETYSWHWLFFVNVLPGTVIACTIPILGRVDDPDPTVLRGFDLPGVGLMATCLASLEYILEEGYRWGWLGDDDIRHLAILSLATGLLFIWRSLHHPSPVVDFRLLRSRVFGLSTLFIFVTGFGLFGAIYVLPLFLARIAGFNALQVGEAVFSAGLGMILGAPLIARLTRLVDLRILITVGLLVFALSLAAMTPITSAWTGVELFWPQFVRGFSILLCIVPATTMALGTVPPERLKMASALFNTVRNLGGAIGIALVNSILNDRTNLHWLRLAEALPATRPELKTWLVQTTAHLAATTHDPLAAAQQAAATLAGLVRREATTMAFSDTLWIMAAFFFAALAFVPLLPKLNKASAPKGPVETH